MDRYVCQICGYVYDPAEGDPDSGIAPGTPLKSFPTTGPAPFAAPTNQSLKRKIKSCCESSSTREKRYNMFFPRLHVSGWNPE